tara:strand:+ start:48 stop:875 length:828 start_codon:yes stop_codon:yes gene_type:complete
VKGLSEDKDTFIIHLDSLGSKEPYISTDTDFPQVYDALLKKWLSRKNHVVQAQEYWKEISDKQTSQHYIEKFYSIIQEGETRQSSELENSDLTTYVDFFIAPTGQLAPTGPLSESWVGECTDCFDSGYVTCLECNDYDDYYCDNCEDKGYVDECISCNDASRSVEFLVGGVLWYNFKNPYTEEKNNAGYISQILYFGTYEFYRKGEQLPLNENDITKDVESAYIWSEISKLPPVVKLMEDKKFDNSYYGFEDNYNDLVSKIGKTISKSDIRGSIL